ncbi:Avidin-related protein 1, partial [Buceros rhinoceros silvestris]
SPLLGSLHPKQFNATFGFTVNWNFSEIISVFTGQCFMGEDGKETLKTMWLRRSHAKNITDDWKATMVGTNTFTRQHLPEE